MFPNDKLVLRVYTTAPVELDFEDVMEVSSDEGEFVKTSNKIRLVEVLAWKRHALVKAYLSSGFVAINPDEYARALQHGIISPPRRRDGAEPLAPPNPDVPFYREEK